MEKLAGKKTYFLAILGGIIVGLNAMGVTIPGVDIDPNDWMRQFMDLGFVATFRAALAKIG